MRVKEVMHQNAEWVDPDTCVPVLAETMRSLDIGALVVKQNDKLIGMVTDREIVYYRGVAEFGIHGHAQSARRHDRGHYLLSRNRTLARRGKDHGGKAHTPSAGTRR